MSIPVLKQVYDETRRLAIAGSVTAVGDFRLKKLVAPLELAGQKAPVFAKVGQAVQKLVDSSEKSSAEPLLELSTLVNAILYTQGETGADGELQPIETRDLGQHQTQTSARVLKPLLEALTTTGSGRLEIIADAYERGAFRDLRLVEPALAALDDPYPEIATLIRTKVLPLYGKAIVPGLREKFDLKGRGGHIQRLHLMHQLDPDGSRGTVKQALDDGSKEMRVAAIECLGELPEDLAFLLDQAKARAKDVRAAALKALSKADADEAVDALCKAVKGADLELAIEPVRDGESSKVLDVVLGEAEAQLRALLTTKEKDKGKLGNQVYRMQQLLECLSGRKEKRVEDFLLNVFKERDKLAAIKGEPNGKVVVEQLVGVMAGGSKAAQLALVESHATLPADLLGESMLAAVRSRSPAEVYETFSPYLAGRFSLTKKGRDETSQRRKAIAEAIIRSAPAWHYWGSYADDSEEDRLDPAKQLDPRWLDVAVKAESLELVQALARPGHAGTNKMLASAIAAQLKKPADPYALAMILSAMARAEHPEVADSIIAAVTKFSKGVRGYAIYPLANIIPRLPKEAVAKIDELLSTLPEEVVEFLLDPITRAKSRA